MGDPETTRRLVASWRAVHEKLASTIARLDDEELAMRSYASEWTITKVISHMGSGAEIFTLFFDAATGRGEAPAPDQFGEYWAAWDVKSPRETAVSWREHTAALLAQVEGYDDDVLANASLELFGRVRSIFDIAAMRLTEDTLHGWDIAVVLDGDAELDPNGVPWILDTVGEMVGYAGKVVAPLRASVRTAEPDRTFELEVDERVSLRPVADGGDGPAGGEASLALPAAAFVRLLFGRMDPARTPDGVQASGVDLDVLRATFPGI